MTRPDMQLQFLGAAGTVTGSRYLLRAGQVSVLIDCGLFQGYKMLRLRNRAAFPVPPHNIDAVVLTHAHLDHSGYLPLLVKNGYAGRIVCTEATRDLCRILLPDSGHLQEREAEFANRHGFSKHRPALPLYTEHDAHVSLRRFDAVAFHEEIEIARGVTVTFRRSGHILGAATAQLRIDGTTVLFSGDLGRPGSATMLPPEPVERTDYLVIESTYGNRRHAATDAQEALGEVINRTASRGGSVLIPTFAVGRVQDILYHLAKLKAADRIPRALPVYVDSPMAVDAAAIFRKHAADHRLTPEECHDTCGVATEVRDVEDSKHLDTNTTSKIILSASGMATGGRVLHHLKFLAPDARNTVLFAGFQAGGTRGAAMVAGAQSIKIHGEDVPVRAEVANLEMLSAHADADEVMAWLRNFREAPTMTFVTHGEPAAADALRARIQDKLKWRSMAPEHMQAVAL